MASVGVRRVCADGAEAAVVCLLIGFFEESAHRGYLQFALTRAIGCWWAALMLSAAFGLGHGHLGTETLTGLLGIGLGALVFTLSLWYTKSLYWAVGFHAAWDWGQVFLFGWGNRSLAA